LGRGVPRGAVVPDHVAGLDALVDGDVSVRVEVGVEEVVAVLRPEPHAEALARARAETVDPPVVDGHDRRSPGGDHVDALVRPGAAVTRGPPGVAEGDGPGHRADPTRREVRWPTATTRVAATAATRPGGGGLRPGGRGRGLGP